MGVLLGTAADPAGKIMAPFMPALVSLLRAGGLDLTDTQVDLLARISVATISTVCWSPGRT